MVNWFVIKKFLLISSIGTASAAPFFALNKGDGINKINQTSEFKKNFLLSSSNESDLYHGTKLVDFFKDLLLSKKGRSELLNTFTQKLSKELLFLYKNDLFNFEVKKIVEEELSSYEKEVKKVDDMVEINKNEQSLIFDNFGGTRESMKELFYNNKSYEFLKKKLTSFEYKDFTINKHKTKDFDSFFLPMNNFLSQESIEDVGSWSKIAFSPSKSSNWKNESESKKKFLFGKYDFLNWSYRYWYKNTLPFYSWMSLWKHDPTANATKLEAKYDKSTSTLDSSFPNSSNYNFPIFSAETNKKFKTFATALDSGINDDTKHQPFIPRGHSEDSSTSILINSASAHTSLFTEFASATNYLFSKLTSPTTSSLACFNESFAEEEAESENGDIISTSSGGEEAPTVVKPPTLLDEITQTELAAVQDLRELFLKKTAGSSSSSTTTPTSAIKIDSSLVKAPTTSGDTFDQLFEVREVKDKDFLFLRNEAGVHAIKVDGASYIKKDDSACKLSRAFHHFNFRNLQTANKESLKLQKTLDMPTPQGLDTFKLYIEKNFDQLFSKYYFSAPKAQEFLFSSFSNKKHLFFEHYKKIIAVIDEMIFYKNKHLSIENLRKAVINKYSGRDWKNKTDDKKFDTVAPTSGLAGKNPFPISTTSDKVFDLENLFDLIQYETISFVGEQASSQIFATTIEKFENLWDKYKSALNVLITTSNTKIEFADKNFFLSNRLFLSDLLLNQLYDKLLDDEALINQTVKKRIIKSPQNTYVNDLITKGYLNRNDLLLSSSNKYSSTFVASPASATASSTESTAWFSNFTFEKAIAGLKENYFLNSFYFNNTNWFESLKYGKYKDPVSTSNPSTGTGVGTGTTSTTKNEGEKMKEFLLSNLEKVFKESFFLSDSFNEDEYLNFLITFSYLTKDNFKNIRSFFTSKINPKSIANFVFQENKTAITSENDKTYFDLFTNPFIDRESIGHATKLFAFDKNKDYNALKNYFLTIDDFKTPSSASSTSSSSSAPSSSSTSTKKHNFIELNITESSTNWTNTIPLPKSTTGNLFSFGSRANLVKYIEAIESSDSFNKLLSLLQSNFPSWKLDAVTAATIQVSNSDTTTAVKAASSNNESSSNTTHFEIIAVTEEKTEEKASSSSTTINKTLYLQDKKNALIAFVNNHKLPDITSPITKEEAKKIYGFDIDKSEYTKEKNTVDSSATDPKNIEDAVFTRPSSTTATSNNDWLLIATNQNDFATKDSFKTFVDDNLTESMFIKFLFSLLSNKEVKEAANKDFESNSLKIFAYDQKFKKSLNTIYI